jgi:hypothetical protein
MDILLDPFYSVWNNNIYAILWILRVLCIKGVPLDICKVILTKKYGLPHSYDLLLVGLDKQNRYCYLDPWNLPTYKPEHLTISTASSFRYRNIHMGYYYCRICNKKDIVYSDHTNHFGLDAYYNAVRQGRTVSFSNALVKDLTSSYSSHLC